MKTREERLRLLAEMDTMTRPLPLNPDRIGLASLFELSSVLFQYRERMSAILREALDDLNEAQKSQIMAKEQHRVKSNEILNRDEIKILKPIAVQQAACEIHLTPFSKAVMDTELLSCDANTFLTKVRIAHEDIKDKIRTIRLQADINDQMSGHSAMPGGNNPFGQKGASIQ